MVDKVLYKPTEVAEAIGVSRARAYDLIARGVIPSIRLGASIRVPVVQLREWVNNQVAAQRGGNEAA